MKTKKNQKRERPIGSLAKVELTRIIQDSVLGSSTNSREIAKKIDKPYPTLMREINPEDTGAKVGVNDLIPLMEVTGNIEPLTYLANSMKFLLIPYELDIKDTNQATLISLDLMEGFGRYANALKAALKGRASDPRVVLDVEKYGHEAMTAIMTMCHYLRKQAAQVAMSEGGPNSFSQQ